jgi:hypothetical protein
MDWEESADLGGFKDYADGSRSNWYIIIGEAIKNPRNPLIRLKSAVY